MVTSQDGRRGLLIQTGGSCTYRPFFLPSSSSRELISRTSCKMKLPKPETAATNAKRFSIMAIISFNGAPPAFGPCQHVRIIPSFRTKHGSPERDPRVALNLKARRVRKRTCPAPISTLDATCSLRTRCTHSRSLQSRSDRSPRDEWFLFGPALFPSDSRSIHFYRLP